MKITHIGKRGIVFTFDDLKTPEFNCITNIYVIATENYFFICDTFLGPDSMKSVKDYLKQKYGKKNVIIFNSHYDWDHHWGNSAFKSEMIIGHILTRKKIFEEGQKDFISYKNYQRGKIILTPPNFTFQEKISFKNEGVEFFYSPGHTTDSSSCYDRIDKIIYAADNLEEPLPYIRSTLEGVKQYIKTLEQYLVIDFQEIIIGHGPISKRELIQNNLNYLKSFPSFKKPIGIKKGENEYYLIHIQNLATLAESYYNENNFKKALKYYKELINFDQEIKLLQKEIKQKLEEKIKELNMKIG